MAAAAPAAVTDPTPPETNEIVAPTPGPAEAVPVAEIQPSPRKAHVSRRAASVGRPESPAPTLSEEIRALDQSIGLLRRDRDPDAALSTLDAYLARYPHGVLNREARLARVDALLMLQRARSDCARAEEDYSAVLARSSDAALVERALYGRGACRAKRGDGRGAAEDLRRYLERFPSGAHAAWARQWLESAGQSFMKGG
jgi:hypothetical protein